MLMKKLLVVSMGLVLLNGCGSTPAVKKSKNMTGYYAEIVKVNASKASFGSSFSLDATVKSSDKNCDHYVNWWEAVSEDGKLLYRRTLGHPHSNEQPFNRGGSTAL